MTIRPRLLRPLLAATVAAATIGGGAVASTAATQAPAHIETSTTQEIATDDDSGKLLLMLDSSGSMNEDDPSGGTKMDAAKKALTGVVDDLPKDANVGLRVYGAKEPGGKPTKAACADTQLEAPIKPLDRAGLKKTIKGFTAKGETPIAHSLEKGLEDLGDTGKRNIVLVSDGEESCVPDPCPVVKKLVKDGVDLRIDTVGFDVSGKARKQLQCLADAGNGSYYDAEDAEELSTNLKKLSTRAVRDFQFTGTPITGVDLAEDEQPSDDLPMLTPGAHTDKLTATKDTWRAYEIERTKDGSTLHVSVATKPSTFYKDGEDRTTLERLGVKILAPDGTECAAGSDSTDDGLGLNPVATASARLVGQGSDDDLDSACTGRDSYTVLINRDGALETTPAEIQVIEEPRVTNLDELPEAADEHPSEEELPAGKTKPVTGGLSFADAAEVTSGTWVDTLVPGETLLYRVKVEDGQTVRFTANGPTGGFRFPEDSGNLWVDGRAFGPNRQTVDDSIRKAGHFSSTHGNSPKSVTSTEVRYKNRYSTSSMEDEISAASMGGWYYYSVGVGTDDLGEDLAGQPIKIAFTVDVEGKPSTAVKYDGPVDGQDEKKDSTTDEASSTSTDDEGSALPWVWIGGGAVVALLLGAGTWVAVRRLRTGRTG